MVDITERAAPSTKAERIARAAAHLKRAEEARLARALFDLQRAEVAYIEQYQDWSRGREHDKRVELKRAEDRVDEARKEAALWTAVTDDQK